MIVQKIHASWSGIHVKAEALKLSTRIETRHAMYHMYGDRRENVGARKTHTHIYIKKANMNAKCVAEEHRRLIVMRWSLLRASCVMSQG